MQLLNVKTGKPEEIPDQEMLTPLAAGTHTPIGAKALLNPDGELVFSPLEDVHANLAQYGYAIPTQDQLSELANQRTYGEGAGNTVKAALEGVSRGTTFGLSDVLEPHLLGTTAEAIKQRRERNPIASTAGEIGGAVGSALLAPELSPAGVVAKLGTGVAEHLAPAALGEGASLAGQVVNSAAQIGARAAGSAVEGAAYGLGQSVTEAALGDPNLNSQKILANIGYGGFFGGALGGLLKAGELAIPASLEKAQMAVQDTYDRLVGKVTPEGEFEAGPLTKGLAKAGSFATGQPEEEILDHAKQVFSGTGEVLGNKERAQFGREFNDAMQQHYQAINKASLDASTLVRPQESAALLEGVSPEAALQEATRVHSVFSGLSEEMKTHPELYPARFPAKLGQIMDGLEQDIHSGASAADVFKAITEAKQALDSKIPWNKELTGEAADAIDALKGLRSQIKQSLENEDIWGQAGARTAAYNDAVNDFLATKKAFQTDFMKKVPTRSGGVTYKINPTKTNSFFNMINDPRGEAKNETLTNFFRASRSLVDEIDKTYSSAAFEKFDKPAMQSLLETNEGMANRAKNIIQAQPGRGFGAVTDMFGAAMAATGNPLAMLGLAARSVLDPHTTINRLSNLERAAQKSSAAISNASRAALQGTGNVSARAIGPVAGKLGAAAATDQYETNAKHVEDYNTAPAKMLDKLDWVTRDLYHVAPNLSSALQMTALRGNQFLGSKLPKPLTPPLPFDAPFKPSVPQMIKFNRYYQTVHRPLSALGDLSRGTVHPETVEALQAVYPELYGEMKTELLDQMTAVLAKKATLPYQQRLAVAQFLGRPLDTSMRPANIQVNQGILQQQSLAKKAQEAAPTSSANGIGKLTLSDRLKTNIQDTAQRDRA